MTGNLITLEKIWGRETILPSRCPGVSCYFFCLQEVCFHEIYLSVTLVLSMFIQKSGLFSVMQKSNRSLGIKLCSSSYGKFPKLNFLLICCRNFSVLEDLMPHQIKSSFSYELNLKFYIFTLAPYETLNTSDYTNLSFKQLLHKKEKSLENLRLLLNAFGA